MMNKLLLFLLMFWSVTSLSQSKHGFETGLDTLAAKHHIHKQTEYIIHIDSTRTDTIVSRTKIFDTTGYLIEINEIDYLNRNLINENRFWMSQNKVTFEYNENGYLINENYNWSGPVGSWGKDTITKVLTQTWKYVDNEEFLTKEINLLIYPDQQWTDSCSYYYHNDGRQKVISCISSPDEEGVIHKRNTYFGYNDRELLIEIKTDYDNQRTIRLTTYEYAFYE